MGILAHVKTQIATLIISSLNGSYSTPIKNIQIAATNHTQIILNFNGNLWSYIGTHTNNEYHMGLSSEDRII